MLNYLFFSKSFVMYCGLIDALDLVCNLAMPQSFIISIARTWGFFIAKTWDIILFLFLPQTFSMYSKSLKLITLFDAYDLVSSMNQKTITEQQHCNRINFVIELRVLSSFD